MTGANPQYTPAAATAAPVKAHNVVLVHGLFADGSCWSDVIARKCCTRCNNHSRNPCLPTGSRWLHGEQSRVSTRFQQRIE
jgi:hypothetical protein